jgi:hypothetical protein
LAGLLALAMLHMPSLLRDLTHALQPLMPMSFCFCNIAALLCTFLTSGIELYSLVHVCQYFSSMQLILVVMHMHLA